MNDQFADANRIVSLLAAGKHPWAELLGCFPRGNPQTIPPAAWKARVVSSGIPNFARRDTLNGYCTLATFRRSDGKRRTFRRRKELWVSHHAVMIDDLGTGSGSHVELGALRVPPTWLIETSPDNFQAVYHLAEPVLELDPVEVFLSGVVKTLFDGQDPGMLGATRIFRLPGYVNAKPEHDGWRVRLADERLDSRPTLHELAEAYGVNITSPIIRGRRPSNADLARQILTGSRLTPEERARRAEEFAWVMKTLQRVGMVKSMPRGDGWIEVRCPWVHEHTNGADNGAAVRMPDEMNEWCGAFVCHHGSHNKQSKNAKGWRDLAEEMTDYVGLLLEEYNREAAK